LTRERCFLRPAPAWRARGPAVALIAGILLSACAVMVDGGAPRNYVGAYGISSVRPDDFAYCHGAACQTLNKVTLTADEWTYVQAPLVPAAAAASEERERIAAAVARYEETVGAKTGTANDKGGNLSGLFGSSQIDCVSETVNTTTLILMLDDAGLLRWHTPWNPSSRFTVSGWFHSTAVVREKASGVDYAIDSWFYDNGQPAAVVALKDWQAGWVPK